MLGYVTMNGYKTVKLGQCPRLGCVDICGNDIMLRLQISISVQSLLLMIMMIMIIMVIMIMMML